MIRLFSALLLSAPLIFAAGGAQTARAASCSESTAFLARTSGLDGTHTTAYDNLICGLVTDGVWSKLDVLYIFATADAPSARLNLMSSSYTITVHNTPTFTVDRGYQATCCHEDHITWAPDTSDWLDTGFDQFRGDTAHISVWNITDAVGDGLVIGADAATGIMTGLLEIKSIGRVPGLQVFTVAINGPPAGLAIGTPTGHLVGTRWCPNGHCSDTTSFQATITVASPAVITTSTNHNLVADLPVFFATDGALPAGIVVGPTYYVISAGLTATQFGVSTTIGGAAVNTSGSQSGNQYVRGPYTITTEYQNGASLGDIIIAPIPGQGKVAILQKYNARHSFSDTQHQIAMASVGAALNPTDASTFYSRLRTYMTAVGVP